MKKLLLIFIISYNLLYGQSELINLNQPVYRYLFYKHVSGSLDNFDNIILPLTKKEILSYLEFRKDSVASKHFISRLSDFADSSYYFYNNLSLLKNNLFSNNESSPLFYKDSLFKVSINPIFNISNIGYFSGTSSNNGGFILYGGNVKFNYQNNMTAFLEAWNGYIYGDSIAVSTDKRVKQSFTYNHTKIKYFDGTRGYINYKTEHISLFTGRNELKWGVSDLNPMIIGNGSQLFDFVKFDFKYKSFRYTFLHGWLVLPKSTVQIDSLVGAVYRKNAKYIAINRIGFNPTERLKIGITQEIIYANRNIELSYLNPFLLWESAQRSLNDLDNSFLNFDIRYLLTDGLEVYGSCTFDDLNFNLWGEGKWNTGNNRLAFQGGFNLAYPLLWQDILFSFDYVQIRPFTFSHPEVGESLSYTNNGFPLGLNMFPNSIAISAQFDYFYQPNILLSIRYDNIRHGDNIYDDNGNLVFNYGGSYLLGTTSILTTQTPHVLDGNLSTLNSIGLKINYLFSANLTLSCGVDYYNITNNSNNRNIFNTILSVIYNNF